MAYYRQKEFGEWLRADSEKWNDSSSVSSYKSGMGSLISWLDTKEVKSLWTPMGRTKVKNFECYLKSVKTEGDRRTLFSAAINIIQKAILKSQKGDKKFGKVSTLQNYKSYLNAYEKFFRNEPFNPKIEAISSAQLKLLRKNSSSTTYTRAELIKEFSSRLLTQDRISMSKDVLFPIRLIRKLWKPEAEAWANEVSMNIYLILCDGLGLLTIEKQIKDILTLRIEKSGDVFVSLENSCNGITEFQLYTSYSDPHENLRISGGMIQVFKKVSKKPVPMWNPIHIPYMRLDVDKNQNIKDVNGKTIRWHIKPARIKSIGDIAIDHDIPISLFLIENSKKLKGLKRLSDKYQSISGTYGLSVTAKNVNKFCSMLTKSDITSLQSLFYPRKDMNIIKNNCKLVLMESGENSIKSDS